MNAWAILACLLVLAYVGDALGRSAGGRAFSFSSGAGFLLLGVLGGPLGLGSISRETLATLAPLTLVGASWLALAAGSHFGFAERRRVPRARLVTGFVLGVVSFVACALAAWALAPVVLELTDDERLWLALGLGAAGSETARAAAAWGSELLATGPVRQAFADLAEADDVVPLLGLAVLFAMGPQPEGAMALSAPLRIALTIGLGACLGAVAAVLTRVEQRTTERWGILFGAALLVVGLSTRVGLAAPTALFMMGATLNVLARDGAALREMLGQTTRPVLLPMVTLAGAHLDISDGRAVWLVVALVPLARIVVKLGAGLAMRKTLAPPTVLSRLMGLGMLGSGALTVCVGLTVAARFPGSVGRLVLAGSLASVVVGEVLGLPALRRELVLAREWGGDGAPSGAGP